MDVGGWNYLSLVLSSLYPEKKKKKKENYRAEVLFPLFYCQIFFFPFHLGCGQGKAVAQFTVFIFYTFEKYTSTVLQPKGSQKKLLDENKL